MTNEELQVASKQVIDLMINKTQELIGKFGINKTDAMVSVLVDQVSALVVLQQESKKESQMPTRKERDTVAKLMVVIANVFDESRKEALPYDQTKQRPEFTLEELRPLKDEAMAEAQAMLASWGN